jgi:hypothetical protein
MAREAYSLYRVAKYRWIAMALDPDDQAAVAYLVPGVVTRGALAGDG